MHRDSTIEALYNLYTDFAEHKEPDKIELPMSEFNVLLDEIKTLRAKVAEQDIIIEEWTSLATRQNDTIDGYIKVINNYEQSIKKFCLRN